MFPQLCVFAGRWGQMGEVPDPRFGSLRARFRHLAAGREDVTGGVTGGVASAGPGGEPRTASHEDTRPGSLHYYLDDNNERVYYTFGEGGATGRVLGAGTCPSVIVGGVALVSTIDFP